MQQIAGARLQNLLQTILQCRTADEAAEVLNREEENAEYLLGTVDWEKLRQIQDERPIRFPGITWGRRTLVFVDCDLGDGDFLMPGVFLGKVVFHNVRFGEGDISFSGSEFLDLQMNKLSCRGNGEISFSGTTIHKNVQLMFADLGSKSLNFGQRKEQPEAHGRQSYFGGETFKLEIEQSRGERINFQRPFSMRSR